MIYQEQMYTRLLNNVDNRYWPNDLLGTNVHKTLE